MKNLLHFKQMNTLSKKKQKNIFGGKIIDGNDISKCGCNCEGQKTGPNYCRENNYYECIPFDCGNNSQT